MTTILNQIATPFSQVPAYQNFSPTSYISVANAGVGALTNGVNYYTPGMTNLSSLLNTNAALQDILARYGGGGWGVAYGYPLSISGNILNIGIGQCVFDGIIEFEGSSYPLPTVASNIFIDVAGQVLVIPTVQPYSNDYIYLGNLTPNGDYLIYDTTGVPYIVGGNLSFSSGDTFMPSATLPSNTTAYFNTLGGFFFWNGEKYLPIGSTILAWQIFNDGDWIKGVPIFCNTVLMTGASLIGSVATPPATNVGFSINSKSLGDIGSISVGTTGSITMTLTSSPVTLPSGDLVTLIPQNPRSLSWQELEIYIYATS